MKTSEFRLISLKFVLMGPINNTSTMVQEMSWRRTQFSSSYMGRQWYQDWGHCGVTNDLGSSPQPEGEAQGLWCASQVVCDTTMTKIEVSISILSGCLKAYYIYADSCVYKQKIAHKTASNQPQWKAWPQTIVTGAPSVTSWLLLWCHSDACVTKSW